MRLLPNNITVGLSIISLFIISCTQYERFSVQQSIKRNIGKTIDLSLIEYQLFPDTVVSFTGLQADNAIIVTQVQPDLCTDCLSKYIHMAEKYVSTFHSDSVLFVVILGADMQREVQSMIPDVDSNKVIILFTKNNDFLKRSTFVENRKVSNSFLLNKYYKIVLVGDPLTNQKLQYCYNNQIQKMLGNESFLQEKK